MKCDSVFQILILSLWDIFIWMFVAHSFCVSENHNFYLQYDSLKYMFSEDRNAIFIYFTSIVANFSGWVTGESYKTKQLYEMEF
jgi:hypothetical protein